MQKALVDHICDSRGTGRQHDWWQPGGATRVQSVGAAKAITRQVVASEAAMACPWLVARGATIIATATAGGVITQRKHFEGGQGW